jgi:hypothetical protein
MSRQASGEGQQAGGEGEQTDRWEGKGEQVGGWARTRQARR